MNSTTPISRRPEEPLDGFEHALLQELRGVVQGHADAAPVLRAVGPSGHQPAPGRGSRPHRPHRPHRARRWAVPVGVAAAGAMGLAIVQPFGGGTPAFAVEETADGSVTVEILELEGPDALETALAEHGITAVVDYPEEGTMCSPGRYVESAPTGGSTGSVTAGSPGAGPGVEPGGTSFSITLDPADYVGRTLVLESAWFGDQAWAMAAGTAEGEVGPCNPVPAEGPQFEQQGPGSGPEPGSDSNGTGISTQAP